MDVSVLILAKNEEKLIGDALEQITFAKQIVVLDQGSSDKTFEIANKYTNEILKTNETDFSKSRNILLSSAKSKWVLYLDCDERLSPENISEIDKATAKKEFSAFYFARKNIVLGKWLKHGGWYPDYVPKLFLRESLKGWSGRVHETPSVVGEFSYFKEPIVHLTGKSVSSMLEKSIKWAKVEAELLHKNSSTKVNSSKVVKAASVEFFTRYVIKVGFLDGIVGIIESLFQALHKAMVLVYLYELQNSTQKKLKNIKNE